MSDSLKLIGIIDWFHDNVRNANYGFLRHPIIGEHYFNDKSIADSAEITRINSNKIVTFFSRESKQKKGALEAFGVKLLDNETDTQFLLNEYLNSLSIKRKGDNELIRKALSIRLLNLFGKLEAENLQSELAHLEERLSKILSDSNDQLELNEIVELLILIGKIDHPFSKQLEKKILQNVDKMAILNLWLEGKSSYVEESFLEETFGALEYSIQQKVISKLDDERIKILLLTQIFVPNMSNDRIIDLIKLISKTNRHRNELLETLINEQKQFFVRDFWSSNEGIQTIVIEGAEDGTSLRKSILELNIEFLANGLRPEFFADLVQIKQLFSFLRTNLPENIGVLKQVLAKKVIAEIAHELWIIDILENCQIEFIAKRLSEMEFSEKNRVFSKCTFEEKSNILYNALFNLDLKKNVPEYLTVQQLLETTNKFVPELRDKILAEVLNNVPDYIKLNLWIDDFHDELDYAGYKPYIITLQPSDQRLFVKKVVKHIHEGRVSLELNDLTSLNLIDFELSKAVKEIDGTKLDFSTSILLNTIKELSENKTFKESVIKSKILEIIINQINNPEDLLEIEGFYDPCAGRCKVYQNEVTNKEGETEIELYYERSEFDFPRMHQYCDGRKSLQVDNLTPNLHEVTKKEFWWCGNLPCHEPSRKLHSSDQWKEYSLMDFLHILKVNYQEIDLELYLNVINKLNRFLSHMSCRSCNHILRPVGKSNYAFWGVSNFHCINPECTENSKSIYISHCLNGRCGETIDSRDSVRCSPEGFNKDECGWYICANCHSCCSNDSIQRRIDNLKMNNRNYTCHTQGHRDLGIIFCNQCGSKMHGNEGDPAKRKEIVEFFKRNLSNPQIVTASGQRKDGGWWFRFSKGDLSEEVYEQKLHNLLLSGFNVPNIEDKSETVQFVSEPFTNSKEARYLICSNSDCGKKVNLSDDLERARSIMYFHNRVFPRVKIND